MAIKIDLPAEPVDGHEIKFYFVRYLQLVEYRMIYHVNTKWADFDPQFPGGCDIVDQWMHYEGDRLQGRSDRWRTPVENEWRGERFATRREGLFELREAIKRSLEAAHSTVCELRAKRGEVDKEIAHGGAA